MRRVIEIRVWCPSGARLVTYTETAEDSGHYTITGDAPLGPQLLPLTPADTGYNPDGTPARPFPVMPDLPGNPAPASSWGQTHGGLDDTSKPR